MIPLETYTIPIALAQFVIEHDLVRAFSIFLYMKSVCNGVLPKHNFSMTELGIAVGIRDIRTIKKYLKRLINMKWVGYNKTTNNYFVRSFHYLKTQEGLTSRTGIRIHKNRLKTLKYQLCAGVIAFKLRGLKWAQNAFLRKHIGSSVPSKRGTLQMVRGFYNLRSYFGLSNTQLAGLFSCSKSEANRIKIKCIREGLLVANHQFQLLAVVNGPDFLIKKGWPRPNRIRVTGNRKIGIKIYEQLTDELIPMVFCVRMRR